MKTKRRLIAALLGVVLGLFLYGVADKTYNKNCDPQEPISCEGYTGEISWGWGYSEWWNNANGFEFYWNWYPRGVLTFQKLSGGICFGLNRQWLCIGTFARGT